MMTSVSDFSLRADAQGEEKLTVSHNHGLLQLKTDAAQEKEKPNYNNESDNNFCECLQHESDPPKGNLIVSHNDELDSDHTHAQKKEKLNHDNE